MNTGRSDEVPGTLEASATTSIGTICCWISNSTGIGPCRFAITTGSRSPDPSLRSCISSGTDRSEKASFQYAAGPNVAGSIAIMSNCLSVSVNRPICRDRVAMVAGKPRSGGTWVSGPISSLTSLPTKTFAFASTVVRSELTIACDATNTASASDAATRNSVASLDDDARRRTARYHAETRDASPWRRRISATATTRAATIATPSANSNGNRKAADAGRSIVVPVTPPPERRCRTITYAPASARISHGRNITSRASPARGSCFDAKASAVTVPTSAMTASVARSDQANAADRADGSMIPAGPATRPCRWPRGPPPPRRRWPGARTPASP